MKIVSLGIMALILLLPAVVHAEPALTLDRRLYDFGPVKQGQQLSYDFKLTNVGDEDIIIEKLEPN